MYLVTFSDDLANKLAKVVDNLPPAPKGKVWWIDKSHNLRCDDLDHSDMVAFIGGSVTLGYEGRDVDVWVKCRPVPVVEWLDGPYFTARYHTHLDGVVSVFQRRLMMGKLEFTAQSPNWIRVVSEEYARASVLIAEMGHDKWLEMKAADKVAAYEAVGVSMLPASRISPHSLF